MRSLKVNFDKKINSSVPKDTRLFFETSRLHFYEVEKVSKLKKDFLFFVLTTKQIQKIESFQPFQQQTISIAKRNEII